MTFSIWIVLAVFVLGLIIGGNIGVLLACLLNLAAPEERR